MMSEIDDKVERQAKVTAAVERARQRHEFRTFEHDFAGSVEVVRFVCWGGCPSTNYLTEDSARRAHRLHRERELRGQR